MTENGDPVMVLLFGRTVLSLVFREGNLFLNRSVGLISTGLLQYIKGKDLVPNSKINVRKPVFGVSDQVRHKPACSPTEDGYKHENSNLGRRIILSV